MAEHLFKQIGSAAPEAINLAMKQAFSSDGMSPEDKKVFQRQLDRVSTILRDAHTDSPSKKGKKAVSKPDDDDIFATYIVPKLRRNVQDIEDKEERGKPWTIGFNFKVETEYWGLTINELSVINAALVRRCDVLQNVSLILKYYRGLLYIHAQDRADKEQSVLAKRWFEKHFGISYTTGLKYVRVTKLLLLYPRLLACEFSHSQLDKHAGRFYDFLADNRDGLRESLSTSIEVTIQGHKKYFAVSNCDDIPKVKFSADPDLHYYEVDGIKSKVLFEEAASSVALEPTHAQQEDEIELAMDINRMAL